MDRRQAVGDRLEVDDRPQATGHRPQVQSDVASATTVFSLSPNPQPLATSHSSRPEATGDRLEVQDGAVSAATVLSSSLFSFPNPQPLAPNPCTNPQPLTPNPCSRRGVSLLEVLFAMGILLIGLLGVGAMIPAGRFEVLQGAKIDHASAIGRQAFREFKVRGYTDPLNWRKYDTSPSLPAAYFPLSADRQTPPTFDPVVVLANSLFATSPVVVVDPIGIGANFGTTFPASATVMKMTRIVGAPISLTGATNDTDARLRITTMTDPIFRSTSDLEFQANTEGKDLPPIQQWFRNAGTPIRRLSTGSYSWLATVVSDPTAPPIVSRITETVPATKYSSEPGAKVCVTVAIFHKRDLASPATSELELSVKFPNIIYDSSGNPLSWGNDVLISGIDKPVKPGQWIMLAGAKAAGTNTLRYFNWYRVVSAAEIDKTAGTQQATLAGPDWNVLPRKTVPAENPSYVWIIDNVIAVYEKNMKLEIQ